MGQVTHNASSTIVSILNSVGTAAQSITKTIDMGSSSLDMVDAWIQKTKSQQKQRYIADSAEFTSVLITEVTDRAATREEQIQKKMQSNPVYAQLYVENYKRISALFNTETQS